MLAIDVYYEGNDVPEPLWQMRDAHFGMWGNAQVRIDNNNNNKFTILVTATRGDNTGKTRTYYISNIMFIHSGYSGLGWF